VRTLEDLNCTADQIPKYDGVTWGCATDTTAETECPDGHALLGDGSCVDIAGLVQQLVEKDPSLDLCAIGLPRTSGSFVDNCDGTVTDTSTSLMWEKKTDDGGIHDKDNTYRWSTGIPFNPDGEAFTVFLITLNTPPCFAGHCDWRLPKVDKDTDFTPELETIVDCSFGSTCIDPIFFPTRGNNHWSATAFTGFPFDEAWFISFGGGFLDHQAMGIPNSVRAVRTIGP